MASVQVIPGTRVRRCYMKNVYDHCPGGGLRSLECFCSNIDCGTILTYLCFCLFCHHGSIFV